MVEESKSYDDVVMDNMGLFPDNPELQSLANKLLAQHFASVVTTTDVSEAVAVTETEDKKEAPDSKVESGTEDRLYATDRRVAINPNVNLRDARTSRWGNVDTSGVGSAIGLSIRQMPLVQPLRQAGIGGLI